MTTEIKYHTKKETIKAVTEDVYELNFCTPNLQNDEEVIMAAIKENSWAFQYASDTLKNNKDFIIKALNDGVAPWGLITNSNTHISSNLEVMSLVVEKSTDGWDFKFAQGEASLNKELAAKALVKWGNCYGSTSFALWDKLHLTLKKFFPKDSFYKKAQAYLYQLEQEKQAKMVSGGSTVEDGLVW